MGNEAKTGKQPYIPIYIGDWEQDTNLLSLEAEAGWLKIVFKMWKNGKTGVYKISTKALQNLWRKSAQETEEIVQEFRDANTCEITYNDGKYTFKNRRMVRQHEISVIRTNAVNNRYK